MTVPSLSLIPMFHCIRSVLNGGTFLEAELLRLKSSVWRGQGSKICTYRVHNPNVAVNGVYRYTVCVVPEYQRMVYTRFRLSAHNLRTETGCWTRVPREARFFDCPMAAYKMSCMS